MSPVLRTQSATALAVRVRVEQTSHETYAELSGDLASASATREMLRQLRLLHRRLPPRTRTVHVDLRRLDRVTIDVAVLLCLQSRLLRARGVVVASIGGVPGGANASADRVLRALVLHDQVG